MKWGSIYHLLKKQSIPEKDESKYCQQILQGMVCLYEKCIVHQDLKCANILLDNESNCKLADFGISKHADNISSMSGCITECDTFDWMSPEITFKKKVRMEW